MKSAVVLKHEGLGVPGQSVTKTHCGKVADVLGKSERVAIGEQRVIQLQIIQIFQVIVVAQHGVLLELSAGGDRWGVRGQDLSKMLQYYSGGSMVTYSCDEGVGRVQHALRLMVFNVRIAVEQSAADDVSRIHCSKEAVCLLFLFSASRVDLND